MRESSGKGTAEKAGVRAIFDPARGGAVDAAVIPRETMDAGNAVEGPAAITEDETTVIVPSSRSAVMQPDGCVDLRTKVEGERA